MSTSSNEPTRAKRRGSRSTASSSTSILQVRDFPAQGSSAQEAWFSRALVDFVFFLSFLQIRIKDERADSSVDGLVGPFIMRPAQWVVWYWMVAQIKRGVPIRLVILKARQFGISTLMCAWLFWNMWRTMHVRCLISVKSKGTSMNALSETMNRFYQSLPEGYRPALRAAGGKRISKTEVYFADRQSGAYFVAADEPDTARGDAYDHAFNTEVGSYSRGPEFFGEFEPAMGHRANTTRILESTAAPGFFRQRYLRAKEGGFGVFLPWSVAPELYSRKLFVDHRGRRKVYRDAETEDEVVIAAADRKEMEFLSRQHEQINESIGRDLLQPVTEEQIWWWHWYCNEQLDGDEEYMRQEFPRDDISAFERGSTSAFKTCLPMVREAVNSCEAECPDYAAGRIESPAALEDIDVEQNPMIFIPSIKITRFFQEREPGIIIFKYPEPGYIYTLGADVADDIETSQDEDDANFSTMCVYCCNTREQVAEWRGQMDPHDFGDEVAKVGYFFNTAMVCIEYNNMGVTTIDRFTKYLQYPNRFKWPILDEAGKVHKKKEMWVTDDKSKQLMIGSFRSAVRHGHFRVRSPGLYEEMLGYLSKDGHYQAGPDTFADRIIAAALAWQCVEQTDFGMSAVLGYVETTSSGAATGQAARAIARFREERADASPFTPITQSLPEEFGDELRGQEVEDSWIWKSAGL